MSFKCERPEFEITPAVKHRPIHLPHTSSSIYPLSLLSTILSLSLFSSSFYQRVLIPRINPFMNSTQTAKREELRG